MQYHSFILPEYLTQNFLHVYVFPMKDQTENRGIIKWFGKNIWLINIPVAWPRGHSNISWSGTNWLRYFKIHFIYYNSSVDSTLYPPLHGIKLRGVKQNLILVSSTVNETYERLIMARHFIKSLSLKLGKLKHNNDGDPILKYKFNNYIGNLNILNKLI